MLQSRQLLGTANLQALQEVPAEGQPLLSRASSSTPQHSRSRTCSCSPDALCCADGEPGRAGGAGGCTAALRLPDQRAPAADGQVRALLFPKVQLVLPWREGCEKSCAGRQLIVPAIKRTHLLALTTPAVALALPAIVLTSCCLQVQPAGRLWRAEGGAHGCAATLGWARGPLSQGAGSAERRGCGVCALLARVW